MTKPEPTTGVLNVALTGGIGSGKSEVSRRLAARGAMVIDADVIAREVVEPGTPGLAEVVRAFGADVLRPDGTLDRARLGSLVFADPEKRAILNQIIHPRVAAQAAELRRAAPPGTIVIYDVPLLVENDLASHHDVVIVVDAPDEVRVARLRRFRNMSEEEAWARIAAQATREERLKVADIVIDNSGSLAQLDTQVDQVWQDLRRRL